MPPFLFNILLDDILKGTVTTNRRVIWWTLFGMLEDLSYANDIYLLAHYHADMRICTTYVTLFTTGATPIEEVAEDITNRIKKARQCYGMLSRNLNSAPKPQNLRSFTRM